MPIQYQCGSSMAIRQICHYKYTNRIYIIQILVRWSVTYPHKKSTDNRVISGNYPATANGDAIKLGTKLETFFERCKAQLYQGLELRSAEREHTEIDWRSDPKGDMGSNGTMKLVSIGLLLLIAYCIAIFRQAMQASVPSRHGQCVALYTQKSDCRKDNRFLCG